MPYTTFTTNRTKNQPVPLQDEEWEREGLLDPAWEKQQRKVFEGSDPLELKQFVLVLAIIGNLNTYICRF